jgi:hypothetical protein
MEPGEGVRTETDHPGVARRARPSPEQLREDRRQVLWALLRLILIMLSAFLGFMAVEAVRAIF